MRLVSSAYYIRYYNLMILNTGLWSSVQKEQFCGWDELVLSFAFSAEKKRKTRDGFAPIWLFGSYFFLSRK